ncbi:MAG: YCF48-related protein, partial [Ignavibacteria bacterium]
MKKILLLILLTLLTSQTNFAQWVQQTSGTIGDLNSVYFVNSQTGWVCGVTGPVSTDRIAKTTDGGITWVRQNAGTFYVLNSIQFINDQTGWAAGIHGTVVKTTNAGAVWLNVFGTTSFDFNDVQFIDSQTGWVSSSQVSGIYKTTDSGLNWSYLFYQYSFRDIHFMNTNNGWGINLGLNSQIMKSTNGGVNWSNTGVPNIALLSIYFIDNFTGWTGGANDSVPERGKMLKTIDSGNNWSLINLDTNTYPRSVYFVNNFIGWFSGSSGKIFKSFNGGINWFRQNSGVTTELRDIFFIDSSNGWSVGENGVILKTTNGGGSVGINLISTEIPSEFNLYQNYPNPFNGSSKIKFEISKLGDAKIVVYDVLGREIETLVKSLLQPGTYEIIFEAKDLSSGIYFYRLV